ncbi:MAG: hypothetical protein OJF55_002403 [Rhodanobacteraceae bacterium]|nr:MAG: hypothetical protein OJF55_002403 [Rhodanobacteraceae bacterium]
MAVTLTIKQVPDRLAEGLRRRAAANRRSQQQELILMLERALDDGTGSGVREPAQAVYHAHAPKAGKTSRTARAGKPAALRSKGKLDLDALWQRARKLGADMRGESSAIVRADRDARHGR